MKKQIKYLTIMFCAMLLIACTKDFIQKDIKNETVSIIAPMDSLKTASNTITFWWYELEGAESYNIQIVKPNFNSVTQLYVDTVVTGDKFNYTFYPGTYQWRIKATNGGGSTVYTTRTLVIDTTTNMNNVSVGLLSPLTSLVTASNTITFSWSALPYATSYDLLITPSGGLPVTAYSGSSTSHAYTFTVAAGTEQKYTWSVKAFNSFSQTLTNAVRGFKIDHKSPPAPTFVFPTHLSTVKDTSSFRWSYSANSDVKYDILYIDYSPDSTFTGGSTITKIVPRSAISSSSFIMNPTLSSPTSTITPSSWYYWKLESVDSAGNVSQASNVRKFKLLN